MEIRQSHEISARAKRLFRQSRAAMGTADFRKHERGRL